MTVEVMVQTPAAARNQLGVQPELRSCVKVEVMVQTPTATRNQLGVQPELRSCVKVEVAVLGSRSLIIRMVSVDVKQH